MSAIGSVGGGSGGAASSTDAFAAMKSEDFIKVMFTELTNQDPLAPNESKDLLEQISTIRAIESDQDLSARLQEMSRQNEIASASTLVGKFVTGRSEGGTEVAGYVDSVSITSDGPVMNLGTGHRVALADLIEVVDPELIDGTGGNEPPLVSSAIPDQVATRGEAWSFTFDRATFSDEESADGLAFAATLEDGATLPSWLQFDPRLRRFTGTVPSDAGDSMAIRVTAIDSYNARASTSFRLSFTDGRGG